MPGAITFRPIEANLTLNDQDILGKMDPYVEFTIGDQKARSEVCSGGGNNPQWKDSITIHSSGSPICLVQIKDKDILLDDKLGYFEIDIRDLETHGRIKKWYPIFNAKQQPTGEILLEAFISVGTTTTSQVAAPLQNESLSSGAFIGGAVPVNQTTHTTQVAAPSQTAYTNPQVVPATTHTSHADTAARIPAPGGYTTQTNNPTVVPIGTQSVYTNSTQNVPIGTQSVYTTGSQGAPLGTQPVVGQAPLANSQASYGYTSHLVYDDLDDFYAQEALIRGVDPINSHYAALHSSQAGTQSGIHQHGGQTYPNQQMTYGHGHHDPNDPNKIL